MHHPRLRRCVCVRPRWVRVGGEEMGEHPVHSCTFCRRSLIGFKCPSAVHCSVHETFSRAHTFFPSLPVRVKRVLAPAGKECVFITHEQCRCLLPTPSSLVRACSSPAKPAMIGSPYALPLAREWFIHSVVPLSTQHPSDVLQQQHCSCLPLGDPVPKNL